MLDPIALRIISIGFGLLLLLASIHKLSDIGRFRAVLADYRLLPLAAVPAVALVLPAAEALLGLAWLFAASASAAAVSTAALLGLYTAGIAVNLLRGRVHISCGCGFGRSSGTGDALSWGLVLRNGILVASALLATLPVSARSIGVLDYVTLIAALLAVVLLFAATNQLIRNRAAIRLWRDTVTRND